MQHKLKVLVCIKQVPDSNAVVRIKDGIPEYDDNTVYVINRYDEYALEEALQLKDRNVTSHIHTISVGPERVQKALRRSLEMGADEAFHVHIDEVAANNPLIVAQTITQFAHNSYDIIFTGVMSEDAMNQYTGQLIAAMLQYNYATGVTELLLNNDTITITRELDARESMQYELRIPCVISIQSSINKPRYPALSNVLRARKQEINIIKPDMTIPIIQTHCYFTMPQRITQCHFIEGSMSQKVSKLYTILHKNAIL